MEDKTDYRFYEGQEVEAFYGPAPREVWYRSGQDGVEKITVVMENGQMSGVPWFVVWRGGRIASKHNGAMMESVDLVK